MEAMGQVLPGQKFAEKRKAAPFLDPRPELAPGGEVTITELQDGETIIHDMADEAAVTDRKVGKGPRRGGQAATEKAVESRARNKQAKKAAIEAAKPPPVNPAPASVKSMHEIDDAMSRLKAITDRVKKGNGNG
jgi:hypothetical protein